MRTGIGYPSMTSEAVWSAQYGVWQDNYPPSALGDLQRPSKPARITNNSPIDVKAVFPTARPVQLFALVDHNLPVGSNVLIQAYSNTSPDGSAAGLVLEQAFEAWPAGTAPVEGRRSIRPLILSAPVTIRSLRIIFVPTVAHPTISIGAIEVSGFWEWAGISPGKELLFESKEPASKIVGGMEVVRPGRVQRQVNGQIDYVKVGGKTNTVLDFQRDMDLDRPFIFAPDFDDPASWSRHCFLAKNLQVPPLTGALYKHDRFVFRFGEHWR